MNDERRKELREWFLMNAMWHERSPAWSEKDDKSKAEILALLSEPTLPYYVLSDEQTVCCHYCGAAIGVKDDYFPSKEEQI